MNQYGKYDDLISKFESDTSSINEVVQNLSKLIFDDSFQYFGKTFVLILNIDRNLQIRPIHGSIIHVKRRNKTLIAQNMHMLDVDRMKIGLI